jgi:hypothetical protein
VFAQLGKELVIRWWRGLAGHRSSETDRRVHGW